VPLANGKKPGPWGVQVAMVRATSIRAVACALLLVAVSACAAPATQTGRPTGSGAPGTTAPSATQEPSAAPSPQRDPGTARDDGHGVRQVWVPGGTFRMGSDEGSATPPTWAAATFRSEHPAHEVALSRGYWIDATEVTVAQFAAFADAGGYDDKSLWSEDGWAWLQGMGATALPRACLEGKQTADQPQVCVTWYEAEAYAAWRGGRLPTEAEWEFAARGPESRVYPWGNEFDGSL